MKDIIEIYDGYRDLGILNRTITEGEEINLVKDYVKFRKERFEGSTTRKLAVFMEVKVGNSYPDVVFVEYNPENYSNWNKYRDGLNKTDLKILYHIYVSNGLPSEDIINQLGVTWKNLLISIEKLYDSKLITRSKSNWEILNLNDIITYKIEAYEAKLNKWDKLLQQAILNTNFASESYALSIRKSVPQKEMLNKFNKFGIGVCIKDNDDFSLIKQAKTNHIPVSYNSIIFNEWIGRIVTNGGLEYAI